jgi:hypothetical protein
MIDQLNIQCSCYLFYGYPTSGSRLHVLTWIQPFSRFSHTILSEATLYYHPWRAVFTSPRFSMQIWPHHLFYQSLVRFLSSEFLMSYFMFLIRIEAVPTSLRPELISLRIEESSTSGRGAESVQVGKRINLKPGNRRFRIGESGQFKSRNASLQVGTSRP